MSVDLYQYNVYCNTESGWFPIWNTTTPTTCPNNNTHSIDTSKTTIINEQLANLVQVREEKVLTGGNFMTETHTINTPASIGTTTVDFSWPFDTTILGMNTQTDSSHAGDIISAYVAPNTVIGTITTDVAINDTVIHVSSSVFNGLKVGYYAHLFNSTVGLTNLGLVKAIDTINLTFTLVTPCPTAYLASAPTYVQLTVRVMENVELVANKKYDVARKKVGGNRIPANTIVRFVYQNNTAVAKKFVPRIEFIY